MLLSIVLPAYNEEENIPILLERLDQFVKALPYPAEVIFVDDHSTDNTTALLRKASAERDYLNYIRLSVNSGSHIAILAGLSLAKGNCAVFMASDLQDPPELIIKMVDIWRGGTHIIWAVRERIEGVSKSSSFFSRLFYKLMNTFGTVYLPPTGADFALLDAKVVKAILASAGQTPSLGGLIASVGFSVKEITYVKQARKHGKSKWTLAKKIKSSIDAFVAFSYAPMRLMIYSGGTIAILGLLYAFVIVLGNIFDFMGVQMWSSLMVAILLIGGIQMLMIGILGEYLWRNLEEARKKPVFILEESSFEENEKAAEIQQRG